jgi:ADP-heptose:LPS heptosyltransferase
VTANERVLVLRALGLGDLLTAVPALRAIRRGLPEHELVLAAPAAFADLLVGPGLADRVLPTAPLSPVEWRGTAPAVAVNLHGSGPQSHRLLLAVTPRRLVAYGCPAAQVSGLRWRPGENEVRRWCRLVEHAGWPADPTELSLPAPDVPSPAPGAVVIHPGAAHPSRRWPAERFAAVAAWARQQGREVVVTGSDDEVALGRSVAGAAGLGREAVLAGRTDLRTLSALVAGAALVVCGDTGVAHLASAFGTPSVVLFGPVDAAQWGPPPGPHVALGDATCRRGDPFAAEPDPALEAIEVDDVLQAAASVRGSRGHLARSADAVRSA